MTDQVNNRVNGKIVWPGDKRCPSPTHDRVSKNIERLTNKSRSRQTFYDGAMFRIFSTQIAQVLAALCSTQPWQVWATSSPPMSWPPPSPPSPPPPPHHLHHFHQSDNDEKALQAGLHTSINWEQTTFGTAGLIWRQICGDNQLLTAVVFTWEWPFVDPPSSSTPPPNQGPPQGGKHQDR